MMWTLLTLSILQSISITLCIILIHITHLLYQTLWGQQLYGELGIINRDLLIFLKMSEKHHETPNNLLIKLRHKHHIVKHILLMFQDLLLCQKAQFNDEILKFYWLIPLFQLSHRLLLVIGNSLHNSISQLTFYNFSQFHPSLHFMKSIMSQSMMNGLSCDLLWLQH